jgi:hypothetical protein
MPGAADAVSASSSNAAALLSHPLVLLGLASHLASWFVWSATKRQAWIVSMIHATVVTVLNVAAISLGSTTLAFQTTAISVGYFVYDAVSDLTYGDKSLIFLAHHLLGISSGVLIVVFGDQSAAITYAWLGVGEVTTPLLYMAKKMRMKWAYVPFAVLFFLVRICLYYFVVVEDLLVPTLRGEPGTDTPYRLFLTAVATLFYAVQWPWMFQIARMIWRKATGQQRPKVADDGTELLPGKRKKK